MKGIHFLVAFVLLALASTLASASASDPSPLQDFKLKILELIMKILGEGMVLAEDSSITVLYINKYDII